MIIDLLLKFAGSGILDKVLDYYSKKDTQDAQLAVENIKAELETRKLQKELIAIEHGWVVTKWCRPAIFYPFALHISAIVLDTVFGFGWGIPKLPDPFGALEMFVVSSYFLTRPIEKGVRSYMSRPN